MAAIFKVSARRHQREVKVLRGLEVRLLGISRDFGEAVAQAKAGRPEPCPRRRLAFRAAGAPPARRRLRLTPLPPEVDRLVVTNWNPTPGVVSLGDFDLELEPGQSAALWVNRTAPLPHAETLYERSADRGASYVFADASPLV